LIYLTMAYLTQSFGMSPEIDSLVSHGAGAGILVQDGESWRLLSHAFLHGGLLHLALNAYALLVLGPALERYLKTWRFTVLYVCSAVSGCLFALMLNDHYIPLVGGSGALFGMLGALLALNVRGGRTTLDFLENQGARQLIGIIVLNLLIGFFIPIVSNSAHIGGLIGGFILIYCFFDTGRRGVVDKTGRAIQAGWIAVFAALVLYQSNPVLRYDYLVKQFLLENNPTRRSELQLYVDFVAYDDSEPLLRDEKEPRTGVLGVAWLESAYETIGVSAYSRALQRWKEESVK